MNIDKFLRTAFFTENLRRLLLYQSELFMFHYSNVVFLLFTVLKRDSSCYATFFFDFHFFCYILILLVKSKQNILTLFKLNPLFDKKTTHVKKIT